MSTYKIVVNGDVLPGFDINTVKENIARTFKLDNPQLREKALAKIFSGKSMDFKKGLSREQASTYEGAMNKAGLVCKVVPEEPASGLGVESNQTTSAPAVASTSTPQAVPPAPSKSDADSANPYAQPTADLETPVVEGKFILVEPKKISASDGIEWIKEGFNYFKKAPLGWIGMTLLFFIITIVLSIIPLVSLVVNIISPVFMGGFMIACYKLTQGEPFNIGYLFEGFKTNFGRLAAVGAIYLLSMIVVVGISAGLMLTVMGQEKIAMMMQASDPVSMGISFAIFFLIIIALMSVVAMAYLFAPVLVVMHDITAIDAMKLSFKGCLRNILPFLLYGIVVILLVIVATIPLGLGFLILMPMLTASIFVAYRQIFTESST